VGHAKERAYRKERAEREREKLVRIPLNIPGAYSSDPRFVSGLPGVLETTAWTRRLTSG